MMKVYRAKNLRNRRIENVCENMGAKVCKKVYRIKYVKNM